MYAYLLCDGGYHLWRVLQCPLKWSSKTEEQRWSRWLESVRKDVECTFGILKGRFRILKSGIRFQSRQAVDETFLTCCVIHNMLLEDDDLLEGWTGVDGHHDEDVQRIFRRVQNVTPTTDFSGMRRGYYDFRKNETRDPEVEIEFDSQHTLLQKKLITHFNYLWRERRIEWVRRI